LSFALHNKEAKLLPSDTFLSRKNAQKCVCDPDPLAGNGEGPREGGGKGREGERRGQEGTGGAVGRGEDGREG